MAEDNVQILADKLKALGDPLRLRILNLLPNTSECDYGNNVSQLAQKLDVPQPTISHHLRILRSAGIVRNRRMCRDVYYWIEGDASELVVDLLGRVFSELPKPAPKAADPASERTAETVVEV